MEIVSIIRTGNGITRRIMRVFLFCAAGVRVVVFHLAAGVVTRLGVGVFGDFTVEAGGGVGVLLKTAGGVNAGFAIVSMLLLAAFVIHALAVAMGMFLATIWTVVEVTCTITMGMCSQCTTSTIMCMVVCIITVGW